MAMLLASGLAGSVKVLADAFELFTLPFCFDAISLAVASKLLRSLPIL